MQDDNLQQSKRVKIILKDQKNEIVTMKYEGKNYYEGYLLGCSRRF